MGRIRRRRRYTPRSGQDPVAIAVFALIAAVLVVSVVITYWETIVFWMSVAFFVGVLVLLIAVMIKGRFIRW